MDVVSRRSRSMSLLLFLSSAFLLVALVAPAAISPPVQAQTDPQPTVVQIMMHNAQTDFSLGKFQRTASNMYDSTFLLDEPGAVQLMPYASLTPFTTTTKLPLKLRNMGVTSLGHYLIVIGGENREASADDNPINRVFVSDVNLNTGAPKAWNEADGLPEIPATNQSNADYDATGAVAGVLSPAVVAVPDTNNPNNGYIYVIGGRVDPPGLLGGFNLDEQMSIGSAATHIGRFENGVVTWDDNPGILLMDPDPVREGKSYGVESAMATSYTAPDGTTYVYLIGGKFSRLTPAGSTDPERDQNNHIFYAEVDRDNGGMLVKPGTSEPGWSLMDTEIPAPDVVTKSSMGLWDGVAFTHTNADGVGMLYVIGGQRLLDVVGDTDNTYSDKVYHAAIDPADGTLTWGTQGTLPNGATYEMSGVQWGGSVYMTGGAEPPKTGGGEADTILESILSNYVDDSQMLDDASWISTAPNKGLRRQRHRHGMAVVQAQSTLYPTTIAFVYAIGGQSGSQDDGSGTIIGTDPDDELSHTGTDTVLFSRIDPEDVDPKYYPLSGGWYYGEPFDISSATYEYEGKTAVLGIYWTARITREDSLDMDVMMEYRVDQNDCDSNGLFGGGNEGWKSLTQTLQLQQSAPLQGTEVMADPDAFSVGGSNSSNLNPTDLQGTLGCIQYRAKLTTNNQEQTPLLLNTGLLVLSNRHPDLWVHDDSGPVYADGESQQLENFDIYIRNLNGSDDADIDLTAVANYDDFRFTEPQQRTSFMVDVFLYAPGDIPPSSPTFPLVGNDTLTATLHLYNQVDKAKMGAGTVFPRDEEEKAAWEAAWRYADPPNDEVTLVDALNEVGSTGAYTLCVAVDSWIDQKDSVTDPGGDWDEDVAAAWVEHGYVNERSEGNNYTCIPYQLEQTDIQVWVEASEAVADQPAEEDETTNEPRNGTFTISRSPVSNSPLLVTFSLKGTAVLTATGGGQQDYAIDPSDATESITIPAGAASVTLDVLPVDDTRYDPDETVMVDLMDPVPPSTYTVVTDKEQATLTIIDDEYGALLPVVAKQGD